MAPQLSRQGRENPAYLELCDILKSKIKGENER